jgi:alkylation response protein AidB-like acyl-CoA dehydrogenase
VDFEFSADQELLRDSVRRFLADKAPIAYVRDAYESIESLGGDHVWTGLRDLGVLGLLVPEEHGGAGMGMVDAAVVLEELGGALCPVPYASSAVGAVSLVLQAGAAREHSFLLPGLADGTTIGTVALYEEGARYEWRNPEATAEANGDMWQLTGTKVHVPDAAASNLFLVTARDPGGVLGVFAVRGDDASLEVASTESVDGSRKEGRLELSGATGWRLGSGDATDAIARTLDRLAVAYVVDGVGAASRALALAVEYAKERVQFDQPIGAFQAVQHLCADMLRALELGRAAGYYACWAADEAVPEEAHRAAVMAKAFASSAYAQLGGSAIQVFGGVGFTWEHDIHLYYKRLLSLSAALGNASEHLGELAHLVID